jgi:hypothetical protein
MAASWLSVVIGVAVAGFVAGMITGIGLKMGVEPDEAGISTFVLKSFCEAMKDVDSSGRIQYNCTIMIIGMAILSIFLAIVSALANAALVGDWRIGLVIYGVGWIIGFLYIILNVP